MQEYMRALIDRRSVHVCVNVMVRALLQISSHSLPSFGRDEQVLILYRLLGVIEAGKILISFWW